MFKKRENVEEIEEGNLLSPKFDNDGFQVLQRFFQDGTKPPSTDHLF